MKKTSSSDLLVLILVLVFAFDLNVKQMNTIHWIGAVVSIVWLVLFIIKLLVPRKDND